MTFSTQISDKKTAEKVVIHRDTPDRYLSTSEDGVAHAMELPTGAADSWFGDSPYTWGAPKGSRSTTVCLSGRWRRHSVCTRTCTPPMVCSLIPEDVANLVHTEVDFDHPTWLAAMEMYEKDDDPERRVHKTSMESCVQQSLSRSLTVVRFLLRDTRWARISHLDFLACLSLSFVRSHEFSHTLLLTSAATGVFQNLEEHGRRLLLNGQ